MRTVVFFDGQNLYHLAKAAWGGSPDSKIYTWPSFDAEKLSAWLVSRVPGRTLAQVRFYTGVPDHRINARWHGFWHNKLRYLRSRGIYVYRGRVNPGGQEKGVDVNIAVDLVRMTYEKVYEAAIIVSQDWDFGAAVSLARQIVRSQARPAVFESAFPYAAGISASHRGVPGTTWVRIDKATYDAGHDPREYRPGTRT